jgi:RNA polymerase sigma factor FliA
MGAEEVRERGERIRCHPLFSLVRQDRMRKLLDDEAQRRRFHLDAVDLAHGRQVAGVTQWVVLYAQKPSARGVPASQHLDEVEIKRCNQHARVRTVRSHSMQRARIAGSVGPRQRMRSQSHSDSVPPRPDGFDSQERRIQGDRGNGQNVRFCVEGVEPGIPGVGGQRFVCQRCRRGRLGIGRKRREPASPGGTHVLVRKRIGRGRRALASTLFLPFGPLVAGLGCHRADLPPYQHPRRVGSVAVGWPRPNVGPPSKPGPDSASVLARFDSELDLVDIVARQLTRRLGPSPLTLDDLRSFGREGLLAASRSFDESRGVPFRRWANVRVRGAMIDGVRQWGDLPRRVYRELRAAEAADHMLETYDEEAAAAPATTAETADARLNAYLAGIATAIAVSSMVGAARDESHGVRDEQDTTPETLVGELELVTKVRAIVATLPDRERALVERHYFEGQTLDAAAASLGLSKSWGSRLHARAIESIARELKSWTRSV